VPQFVIEALNSAPHDSDRYYFWTGNGLIHTRTSKWHSRIQKLFVLAGVRVVEDDKQRRVAGKKVETFTKVKVSLATPHMFRHTLARDLLERGTPMEEVAELLGNDMKTVERYYSKWDTRRQAKLEQRLESFWKDDPMTAQMNKVGIPDSVPVM
jgi:integrase